MKPDFNEIWKNYGVRALSYHGAHELIRKHGLEQLASNTAGFYFFAGDQPVIICDSTRPSPEIRFTIAHELGHIVLGHLNFRRDFWKKLPDCAERETDSFALFLLANEMIHSHEVVA